MGENMFNNYLYKLSNFFYPRFKKVMYGAELTKLEEIIESIFERMEKGKRISIQEDQNMVDPLNYVLLSGMDRWKIN